MADLRRALSDVAPSNRDFSPILYYYHLRYWMSQFQVRFGLLEATLLALLAAYLLRLRPVPLAIFATGFAASALEVVLLFAFQILYGSVYHQVGLIVTMFMLGLGLGSWTMSRRLLGRGPGDLVWLLTALAIYAACLPAAFAGLGRWGGRLRAGGFASGDPGAHAPLGGARWSGLSFGRKTRFPHGRRHGLATLHGRLRGSIARRPVHKHPVDSPARGHHCMPPDGGPLPRQRHRSGGSMEAKMRTKRPGQTSRTF